MFKKLFLGLVVFAVIFSVACGRKNSPKPPEQFAPNRVVYPSARGDLDGVVLSWGVPKTDARGEELRDLASFEITRASIEQGKTPDFEEIATIPYKADPALAASQDVQQLQYRDKDVEVGGRYQYYIIPVNEDGVRGDAGNMISVIFSGTSTTVQIF